MKTPKIYQIIHDLKSQLCLFEKGVVSTCCRVTFLCWISESLHFLYFIILTVPTKRLTPPSFCVYSYAGYVYNCNSNNF
jgi:hypothetical protein